jgi:hypothetical protein
MARIDAVVRSRLGRCLITQLPQSKCGQMAGFGVQNLQLAHTIYQHATVGTSDFAAGIRAALRRLDDRLPRFQERISPLRGKAGQRVRKINHRRLGGDDIDP